MTFVSDMNDDLNNVFFADADFGVSALLSRASDSSADPVEINCIISRGLERIVDGGYIKNSLETEFKTADRVRAGDSFQELDDGGLVVKKYLVGDQLERVGDTAIFAIKVIR